MLKTIIFICFGHFFGCKKSDIIICVKSTVKVIMHVNHSIPFGTIFAEIKVYRNFYQCIFIVLATAGTKSRPNRTWVVYFLNSFSRSLPFRILSLRKKI